MAVGFSNTNKPLNPRGNDASPKGYNRAALYSGKALDFDGVNDILTMPTALTSSLSTTTITHVVNFKTDFTTWSGARYEVFSYNERGVFLSFNNGNIYVYYRHNASGWGNFQIPVGDVKMQEWNHCVIVIDYGNTLGKAYINGQEVVSSALSQTSLAYDANALTIGGQSTYRFFDGQIAGFKIFNTALTAAQVADLYNNPEKVVPTGVDNTALKLWLPMQEGAGTTAYDGSGNGNHGTISGATWTHAIGAPVSQTAVIDWNKGTNLTPNSEDLNQWTKNNVVVTANATTAPDGSSNADEVENDANNTSHRIYQISGSNTSTNDVAFSIYLKYKDHQYVSFGPTDDTFYRAQFVVDLVGGTITETYTNNANVVSSSLTDVGNGWYKLEGVITPTTAWVNNIYALTMLLSGSTWSSGGFTSAGTSVYVWGAQVEYASANGPYIPTFATAQTSDVLLPQGLTSGRDITGVNLFENVRKQGALNLDGQSWAEVHDNASLDITGHITLEAWVKIKDGMVADGILGRWSSSLGYLLYLNTSNDVRFYIDGLDARYTSLTSGWHHIVGLYNGTAKKLYVDGAEVTSNSQTTGAAASSAPIEIGRYQQSTGNTFDGPIAQPRIYNRALTAAEVLQNYNSGKSIYTNS